MQPLQRGRYRVRLARTAGDIDCAQALRWRAFRGVSGEGGGRDADGFDAACRHVLIEDAGNGTLVATFRIQPLAGGGEIGRSYAAQFYDLSPLAGFEGPLLELGRFCVDPERHDPDILRLAWAALTAHVDAEGVRLLFGCSSFHGTDTEAYRDAFALLGARHVAPMRWRPRVKAPEVVRLAEAAPTHPPDLRRALQAMPPLLRSYVTMGGWVSDHAVIDRDLGTLHVFTGLEVGNVPEARARALRLIAG